MIRFAQALAHNSRNVSGESQSGKRRNRRRVPFAATETAVRQPFHRFASEQRSPHTPHLGVAPSTVLTHTLTLELQRTQN